MLYQIQIRQELVNVAKGDAWKALSRIAIRTQALPGCSYCSVLREFNADGTATLIEEWDSEEAMHRHLNSEGFRAVFQAFRLGNALPASAVRLAMVENLDIAGIASEEGGDVSSDTRCENIP